MNRLVFVVCVAAVASCRTLPPPMPVLTVDPHLKTTCGSLFLPSSFRIVHVLSASMFGGRKTTLIGITVADGPSGRIRSVLLTVEGLVLFDATSVKGDITVHRAMAPMDTQGFAQGLFSDVEFIYFQPPGTLTGAAVTGGTFVCRWQDGQFTVERSSDASGRAALTEYDGSRRVVRQAELFPPLVNRFYKKVLLENYGVGGYSLSMDLLEGEPVVPSDDAFVP